MKSVLITGNTIVIICYILVGFFGYATFVNYANVDNIMLTANILEGPYMNSYWIILCQFMLLVGVILSTPLCVLPCKDTIEELWLG